MLHILWRIFCFSSSYIIKTEYLSFLTLGHTWGNMCITLGDYKNDKMNLAYIDQYYYQSIFNYTQLARMKSSHSIHLWPGRQKRGRTQLFARAHRLVRLHGTRCYTAAQCQPHLCPHRHHTLQGMQRSPGCSASHTCPSPHPLTLI